MKVPKYQDWPHKFLIPQYHIFWFDNLAALFTGKHCPLQKLENSQVLQIVLFSSFSGKKTEAWIEHIILPKLS